ncbi:MAG TPA: tRNA pseudouridine(38-40) synthase TruA [Verrucomicrobiae bacterium]|jgi:tRNA pseudouridine38-40 synthase|nr:tRNA pseudouridine(38-40) synthase TruA [Verrucomicrobiae bacterium]
MDTLKFKLVIAYDGTNYAGWQAQKTGVGVQQRVEEALAKLFQGAGRLHSSSRTDTGVHALGMVAHVEIPRAQFRMPAAKLALAINAHLPADVRVTSARRCRAEFHARFDAAGKQYRYFVWNHTSMNPLLRSQAWQVPRKLDLTAMRSAARFFLGKRDFKSLAASRNYEADSTVRTLTRCDIKRSGPLLTFIIEGDGFLYKMCRGIVGTLVQVGQGKIAAGEIKGILASKDRRVAGMTAPAQGLVLWKVYYKSKGRKTKSNG